MEDGPGSIVYSFNSGNSPIPLSLLPSTVGQELPFLLRLHLQSSIHDDRRLLAHRSRLQVHTHETPFVPGLTSEASCSPDSCLGGPESLWHQ